MNNVFEEWQKNYPEQQILRDGILDEEKWNASERRLLFILKEYYQNQEEFDGNHSSALREWASKGSIGNPFFRNLFAWSLAVHHPDSAPPKDGYTSEHWEPGRSDFLKSALINLKKIVGSSLSTEADIKLYAKSNKHLLKEQILQIAPEIIICGGTMRFINNIIFDLSPLNTEKDLWIDKDTGIYFIDAYHPSYRKANNAFYDEHGFIQNAMIDIRAALQKKQ